MRVPYRKLRISLRQPWFVLVWLLPVWLLLNLCWVLIRVLSFRRLAGWLGQARGSAVCIPLLSSHQQRRAVQIRRVVRLAVRQVPWEINCYPQALTACLLMALYRMPYCLCFGVMRDPQGTGFAAHAFTVTGPVPVTGGESFSQYTVLACFVWMVDGNSRAS